MIHSPEVVTLQPENTGGSEQTFVKKMVSVSSPHIPESSVRPEQADLEVLVWKNLELDPREGKIQYVVVGGMNINAVEVHPVLSMLSNHADTIVGIAHPDAPQSKIIPSNSPFNEKGSFANSGHTVLETIKQLIDDGTLNTENPITLIGYSTGGAVLTETIAQHIQDVDHGITEKKFLSNLVLLSPAGMLEVGETEIINGVVDSLKPYWKEFIDEQVIELHKILKNPKKFLESLVDRMNSDDVLEDIGYAYHLAQDLKKYIQNTMQWPKLKEWDAVRNSSILFQLFDKGIRIPRIQFLDALHAHFHRSWIVQPGLPNMSPETPAFLRSRENVGHDVTKNARNAIHDTPVIIWLGNKDKAINVEKFLTTKDKQRLSRISNPDTQKEARDSHILKRAKDKFAYDTKNVHVILAESGHHMTPRHDASILEIYLLKYLYPNLVKPETIYVGSSKSK